MKRFGKYLLAFLLVNATAELLAACGPRPAAAITRPVATLEQAADSLRATVGWAFKVVPGLPPLDSIVVVWTGQTATGGPRTQRSNLPGTATQAVTFWATPVPGIGTRVSACVFPYGSGVQVPEMDDPALCVASAIYQTPGVRAGDVLGSLTVSLVKVP